MDQNQVNDAINVPVSTASSNESMNQNREFSIWQLIKTLIVRCVIVYVIVSFFKRDQTQNTSTKSRNDNENIIATNLYKSGDNFDLYAYISELKYFKEFDDVNSLIWKKKHLIYDDWGSGSNNDGTYSITKSIPISKYVQNNGTIFLHVFIIRSGHKLSANMDRDVSNELIYTRHQLNKYKKVRYVNTKNLLTGKTEKSLEEIQKSETMQYEIKSFWHRNATINVVVDQTKWHETKIPVQLSNYIKFVPSKNMYKPIVYVNTFWNLLRDYTLLNESVTEIDLTLTYQPISLFKWQFYVLQGDDKSKWTPEFLKAFNNIENDDDQDSLKETLLRTSPYLLLLTLVVTILHYFFELLAFKNDIQFWNNRDSLEGLSVRCVFFNAFQALIVLLYVLDNEANFMIRFGCFVGLGIECWKIIKVVDIKFDSTNKIFGIIPIIKFLDKSSYVESSTREYDLMAFRYLSWICFPLFIAYGTYSLIYDEHTGWYSFILSMSYGFLLTFSFIMMTPQLFINYKMKSVAHLPWRMMTYKFLNTFIDDIFAFIIKMPTLHRLRCFRDDIVFVVFLYQRWIYKVDNKRINEFGVSGEMLQQNATQTITVSENDKKND